MTVVLEPPRFDWYSATVERSGPALVEVLGTVIADESPVLVAGKHGYSHGYELRREGSRAAVVYDGGAYEWPHVVATADDANAVARLVRSPTMTHRVARVDVCVDTDTDGAYGEMTTALRACLPASVKAHTIVPDNPAHGATYYVGASTSEMRARLYEKGKQTGSTSRPAWVRYEVQLRPRKGRRAWAASATPVELLGAARWSRRFAVNVLGMAATAPPVRSERVSDLEGSVMACYQQYGPRLLEWLERGHGGDPDSFMRDLVERASNGGRRLEVAASDCDRLGSVE